MGATLDVTPRRMDEASISLANLDDIRWVCKQSRQLKSTFHSQTCTGKLLGICGAMAKAAGSANVDPMGKVLLTHFLKSKRFLFCLGIDFWLECLILISLMLCRFSLRSFLFFVRKLLLLERMTGSFEAYYFIKGFVSIERWGGVIGCVCVLMLCVVFC